MREGTAFPADGRATAKDLRPNLPDLLRTAGRLGAGRGLEGPSSTPRVWREALSH